MSDDVYVQQDSTCYAFTLGRARRQAQRMVERRSRRDGFEVPMLALRSEARRMVMIIR